MAALAVVFLLGGGGLRLRAQRLDFAVGETAVGRIGQLQGLAVVRERQPAAAGVAQAAVGQREQGFVGGMGAQNIAPQPVAAVGAFADFEYAVGIGAPGGGLPVADVAVVRIAAGGQEQGGAQGGEFVHARIPEK